MWSIWVCKKSNDPYMCTHDWDESCEESEVVVIPKEELDKVLDEIKGKAGQLDTPTGLSGRDLHTQIFEFQRRCSVIAADLRKLSEGEA